MAISIQWPNADVPDYRPQEKCAHKLYVNRKKVRVPRQKQNKHPAMTSRSWFTNYRVGPNSWIPAHFLAVRFISGKPRRQCLTVPSNVGIFSMQIRKKRPLSLLSLTNILCFTCYRSDTIC